MEKYKRQHLSILHVVSFVILCALGLYGFLFVRYGGLFKGNHEQPYDRMFYAVALDSKAPDICKKIDLNSSQALGDAPGFSGFDFLQADCYYASAVKLHNTDLCNSVNLPAQAWGTKKFYNYSYDACLLAVEKYPRGDMRLDVQPEYDKIIPFFQALGYTDDNTDYAKNYWEKRQTSHAEEYLERLVKNPAFVEKVASGPSFSEPYDPDKLRDPQPMEIIYSYVGQRLGRKDLCEKISNNARISKSGQSGGDDIPGKACWYSYALTTEDETACEKMIDYEPDKMTSDGCRLQIVGRKSIGAKGVYLWGGYGIYDFTPVLKELGFPVPSHDIAPWLDELGLPHPANSSWNEIQFFSDFYIYLSGKYSSLPDEENTAADENYRKDFLNRVRNLKPPFN